MLNFNSRADPNARLSLDETLIVGDHFARVRSHKGLVSRVSGKTIGTVKLDLNRIRHGRFSGFSAS